MENKFENIFFNGTIEDLKGIKCPNCGASKIKYKYTDKISSLTVLCTKCGMESRYHNAFKPKWMDMLGNENVLNG